MVRTTINITPQLIAEEAKEKFAGWHYSGTGHIQRTALAVIPNFGPCHAQFLDGVHHVNDHTTNNTTRVFDLRKKNTDCMTLFVRTLNNNGVTLQSKEDNMILTRPLRVIVKGSSAAHVATLCTVQSFTVTTAAFNLVEHAAIRHIIEEATKRGQPGSNSNLPDCLLTKLMGKHRSQHGCHRQPQDTQSMQRLKLTPRFQTLFDLCGQETNVNPCVLLMQATAIIITAYEDAGSKFRDRSSRLEAARHHGMAIDSVLMLPILRQPSRLRK